MEKPSVAVPSMVLVIISFIVSNLQKPFVFSVYEVSAFCGSALFELGLAYATCWALVLRKNKGVNAVWINYIVWILLLNTGSIARLLGAL